MPLPSKKLVPSLFRITLSKVVVVLPTRSGLPNFPNKSAVTNIEPADCQATIEIPLLLTFNEVGRTGAVSGSSYLPAPLPALLTFQRVKLFKSGRIAPSSPITTPSGFAAVGDGLAAPAITIGAAEAPANQISPLASSAPAEIVKALRSEKLCIHFCEPSLLRAVT